MSGVMKVLLRDARTGDYFAKEMRWVQNPERAADFGTVETARWSAWACGRQTAAVVVRFEQSECELRWDPVVGWMGTDGGGAIGESALSVGAQLTEAERAK
jgi:hypothetical protein